VQNSNEPTKKQIERHIDWNDFLRVRDNDATSIEDKVLLGIYSYIPPRRVLDYARLIIISDKKQVQPNKNYIYIPKTKGDAELIIDEFKTRQFLKTYTVVLPTEFTNIIRQYLKKNHQNKHLFEKPNRTALKDNEFSTYIKKTLTRLFGKDATANTLRHSYVNHIKDADLTTYEKVSIANQMGQTNIQTQDAYHLRFKEPIGSELKTIKRNGIDYYLIPVSAVFET
jgi:hypothetical protein